MKKKWSILLTANLLSALVSPLVVHAVKPTTQSETIIKNMFQSSQTHETETLTQSDLTKQLLDNSASDTTTENTEQGTLDTTSDTSNSSLLEESTQEQDNVSENKIKSQAKSKKIVSANKVDDRAANFAATPKAATITGEWGSVSWKFDSNTGTLTFTSGGTLGVASKSPWNTQKINNLEVKKIVFTKKVVAPENSKYLFSGDDLTPDMGIFMLGMCRTIEGIEHVDVSKVRDMSGMFKGMHFLRELDLSSWKPTNVENVNYMFEDTFSSFEPDEYILYLNISSFMITPDLNGVDTMFRAANFNKITVGEDFDLSPINQWASYGAFPLSQNWYDKEGNPVGGSGSTSKAAFLKYLAKGNPGTYTAYPPKTPPTAKLTWGTVPYKFDESTGVLTFTDGGTFENGNNSKSNPATNYSPWNRRDGKEIDATKIKKIVFTKPVKAPKYSWHLFSNVDPKDALLSNLESFEHLDYLDTSEVTNMDSFFSGLHTIKTLDLSKFDTRNVTTMNGMFYKNKSITSLNLDYPFFDTKEVTKMSDMFVGMSSLTTLKMSNLNTSKVTDFTRMFKDVSNMTNLDLSQFRTSSATSMYQMFNGMKNLKTINVSSFDTSKVNNMSNMFAGDSSLIKLDVKNFDTHNVTKMISMFNGTANLTELDVSRFNTSNTESMNSMFAGMTNLTSLNLGSFDFTKITDKKNMFGNESKQDPIREITLPKTFSDPKNDTKLTDVPINDVYNGNWVNIDDKSKKLGQTQEFLQATATQAGTYVWGEKAEDMLRWGTVPYKFDESTGVLTFTDSGTFDGADKSPWNRDDGKGIDATKIKKIVFNKSVNAPAYSKDLFSRFSAKKPYLSNLTSIEHLDYLNTSNVTSMDSFFSGLSSIKTLDLSKFDTRNVKDMNGMFFQNKSIKSLNLDYMLFDTSNVTKMSDMFLGMSSLTELNMPKLNTSNVKTFKSMFKNVNSMIHLNLSQFNTSNATNMSEMFQGMSELRTVNISNFDTSNVTNMSSMFNGTSSLTELNVKNFDTSNVTNMSSLFYQNKSLKNLDVTSFNTSKVTNMYAMFFGMENLKKLNVKNFNTQSVDTMEYMFGNVSALTELDVTNFNTSNVTKMSKMFGGMIGISSLNLSSFDFTQVKDKSSMFVEDNLKVLTLPKTFSDPDNATNLNKVPTTDGYNGQWQNSEGKLFGQTDEFLANYNGEKDAGTYVWGRQAELRLVSVPTLYDFGSNNAIRDKAQMLKPKDKSSKNVEVQDDRKAKTSWSLSVKASPLVSEHQESLQQVRYQFGISTSKSSGMPINIMTYLDRQVELPTNDESQALYTITDKSNANETYDTSINHMTLILNQNTGKPKEQYSGTITWSLDMTPQD